MGGVELQTILDSKLAVSVLALVGGGILGGLLTHLRRRLRTLEYTVTHDRVALSADDAVFGAVRVSWQGHEVTNLYSSTVIIQNPTQNDYQNMKFKTYTGDTILLTQFTQVPGTSYILGFSPEFEALIRVPAGQAPTEFQLNTYQHNREYVIPVLNRGQTAVVRFLTTVPGGQSGPAVWVDMLHPGLRIQFRPNIPHVHGVPVKTAVLVGLAASLVVLILCGIYVSNVWLAATVTLVVGIIAQLVGAYLYRLVRFVWRVTVG